MADLVATETRPTNVLTQFITETTGEPTAEALLPPLIIGPSYRKVTEGLLPTKYKGSLYTSKVADYEALSKVIVDSDTVVQFKNTVVRLYSSGNPLFGTVTMSSDTPILRRNDSSGNPVPAGFKGTALGDLITLRRSIRTASTGEVVVSNLRKMSDTASGTAFASVTPGDVLVFGLASGYGDINWKSSVSSAVFETEVLAVGSGGSDITVDRDLPVGTAFAYSVIRQYSTSVASAGPVNTVGTQINLTDDVGGAVAAVEFKIHRALVAGDASADQPLLTDYILTDSEIAFSSVEGTDTNDTLTLDASLGITGFTNMPLALAGTGALVVLTSAVTITVAGQNLTTGDNALAIGDVIYFNNDSNVSVRATIATVTFSSPNTIITINETQATDVTGKTIYTSYKDADGATLSIKEADVVMTYLARSVALAYTIGKISTTSDLTTLGEKQPYNLLRVAVELAKGAAGDNAVYYIQTPDESASSFLRALEIAESRSVYTTVCLSTSATVADYAKSHVTVMSGPSYGKFRGTFVNLPIPLEGAVVSRKKSGILTLSVTLSGSPPSQIVETSSTVTLIDSTGGLGGVTVGQYLKFYEQTGVANPLPQSGGTLANSESFEDAEGVINYFRVYKVKEAVNNTKIKLEPVPYQGSLGVYTEKDQNTVIAESTSYTGEFEIIKIYTVDEIAQAVGRTGISLGSRRVRYVINPEVAVEFTNSSGVAVDEWLPGYMACAALAGFVARCQPHQPLSLLTIPGLKGVRYSTPFFGAENINIMISAGCWILEQVEGTTSVVTIKERTTSQAGPKQAADMVTRNVDEISKALLASTAGIAGPNNNIPLTQQRVDLNTTVVLDARTVPVAGEQDSTIGAQLREYTNEPTVPDALIADAARKVIRLGVPQGLNTLFIDVYA